jgi:dihydroorotase
MVEKMCHAPADCFNISERGYIREGYYADLVLVNPNKPYTVTKSNILYKCGWSPFEGVQFNSSIERTIVNGQTVFADGKGIEILAGQRLRFNRP